MKARHDQGVFTIYTVSAGNLFHFFSSKAQRQTGTKAEKR